MVKNNPQIPNRSGIYILTRGDENGFRYAYVGQAKHILERLAQHLSGYQHIDLSLKKHKLYDEVKNPYGWKADYFECLESELDKYEQEYILHYANRGFQMRNKTQGGQGQGKAGLNEQKASKGYYDGLKQGYQNCLKDIREYFDKYLEYRIKESPSSYRKPKNKAEKEVGMPFYKEIYERKIKEFSDLLKGGENHEQGKRSS